MVSEHLFSGVLFPNQRDRLEQLERQRERDRKLREQQKEQREFKEWERRADDRPKERGTRRESQCFQPYGHFFTLFSWLVASKQFLKKSGNEKSVYLICFI